MKLEGDDLVDRFERLLDDDVEGPEQEILDLLESGKPDTVVRQRLWGLLAICAKARDDLHTAKWCIRRGLDGEQGAVGAELLRRLAMVALYETNLPRAYGYCEKAMTEAARVGCVDSIGRAHLDTGVIRYAMGERGIAARHWNIALELLATSSKRYRYAAFVNLAFAVRNKNPKQSMTYAERAWDLREAVGSKTPEAREASSSEVTNDSQSPTIQSQGMVWSSWAGVHTPTPLSAGPLHELTRSHATAGDRGAFQVRGVVDPVAAGGTR